MEDFFAALGLRPILNSPKTDILVLVSIQVVFQEVGEHETGLKVVFLIGKLQYCANQL